MDWHKVWTTYRKPLLILGAAIALAAAVGIVRQQFFPASPSAQVFTCPMHPQVRSDAPGDCPICGMRLVPISTDDGQRPARHSPRGGGTTDDGVYISPNRQQLIGVKTEIVERRPAIQDIRTVGRVAFDPDLLIAQREYVAALQLGDRQLAAAAELHLQHLGISTGEMDSLRKTKKVPMNLFLPQPGDTVWIYAPLYEHELPYVRAGATAVISVPTSGVTFPGTVRSINPTVEASTRSAHARIEVPGAGGKLRPEAYVNTNIQVGFGEHVVVPASAIIDSGTRKMVVVHTGNGYFAPRAIETGPSLGDAYVVQTGLAEGEEIVTRATFLVDSESRLKAALWTSSPPTGTGHEGHQHDQ